MTRKFSFLLLLAALMSIPAIAFAQGTGIVGSKHDLSTQSWSNSEVCFPCHTPHHANPTVPPLWNHTVSTATYTLYTSERLKNPVAMPGYASVVCLSCHDGTVAVDALGGAAGASFMSGKALIGTDLSNDHPVGALWAHGSGFNGLCSSCHGRSMGRMITKGERMALPFYKKRVECASCHDAHNKGAGEKAFLRKKIAFSELCYHCHSK